jgi:hypothetical protein
MPTFVVSQGQMADVRALAEMFEINAPVIVDATGEITKGFEINTTPFGLAMDSDWTVRAKGVANNDAHLEALASFHVTVRQGPQLWVPRDRSSVTAHNVVGGEAHGAPGA